ncbi:uncharacterized protein LOC105761158 [Gossypium raimondii]|uniref:PHD-type domain-containing protein n=1 Tax=Gossypium raimondii TaxID=29730 RepID=A0A0D2TQ15_GOSRA|nr:uncharacterized protein LOC105761158 [Gossypium raimondii]KJB45530.1 hypothetical protein B456_007G310300 [Gossypium raimondii]
MDIIIPPCIHTSFIRLTETKESRCEECGGQISGTAFTCIWCKVWKHISCADKLNRDLPLEIIHPLHLQHRLQLQWDYFSDFICDKCLYLSTGCVYKCSSCDFSLDLTCGSSISGQLPKDQEPLRFKDGKKKTIFHYSHRHELGFFKYRKVREKDYDCFWCEKHLLPSEVCYGCTIHEFYLHQVCGDKIPRRLSDHCFHPKHPLRLTYTYENRKCNVCSEKCDTATPLYVCEICSFRLDFHCAKLSPSLKLDCHHHLLTFFEDFNQRGEEGQDSYCKACGKHCDGASVYRCVQCHFSLHLKCVVPSSATHKYHRHPLTMMKLIKEDDSEKYYCDVCENERNPKDPVYYCRSCTFIAHIQCVLDQDKVASGKLPSSSNPPMENKVLFVEQNEGSHVIRTLSLFRPIIHPHQMYEVTEELKGENYCSGCRMVLNGSSYFCKTCPDFYLHEKCAKLSYEIRHPFHSSHPLNLYTSRGPQLIACEECRDICDGFIYFCEQCNFKLDMKCAALTTHKIGVLEEKMTGRVTELHHFTHPHKLVLTNCNDPNHKRECNICRLQILGPAYFCPESCTYILHESCLRLPQKIRVPFHPNHMLVGRLLPTRQRCYACTLELLSDDFVYSCEHCDFNLHAICANSLRRPLKCEFHLNVLYYFGRNHKSLFDSIWRGNFHCAVCDGSYEEEPFYRCLKCDIKFHLKCVRIPYTVKSKYHIHPLILKDSFIEDDSGKYYCDFCEEERNPNDDIYYCEECNGQTIAHIECVLAQVEDNIEIRKNIHEERFREELENLVARFMKFLSNECRPPIEEVIQAGVVPRFVELLGSPSDYVREQAVLVLGNIAAVSLGCRDLVLGHGALLPLLALLNEPVSRSMLRNATWTLSRFCKPPFDQVKLVLPTLARLIHSKDEVVLAKACRALSYLSDGTNDKIQAVIEAGVLGRLVELLMHPSPSVLTSALYTVRNIVTGDDVQTQCVISHQALPCLSKLLTNNYEKSIKVVACWIISNITARNEEQIQAIIEANIIAPLVHLLQNAEMDIRKQAGKAISNAASGGTHDQIRFLVSQGCIKPLCDLLYYADPEVVKVCLQGLENILKVGEADKNMGITGGVNLYAQMINAAKGRESIEYLWYDYKKEIYEKTLKILKLLKQSSILQG